MLAFVNTLPVEVEEHRATVRPERPLASYGAVRSLSWDAFFLPHPSPLGESVTS